jgi:hypothetical protein
MSFLGVIEYPTGLVGTSPSIIYVSTSDTFAVVTAAGYLNQAKVLGNTFSADQMALVLTSDDGPVWLQVSIDSLGNVSLIEPVGPGDVLLPTIANHLIVSTDAAGTLGNLTGTAINNGSLQAGLSGTAGTLISFPATSLKGSLIIAGVANTGNTSVTISNAAFGQATVMSFADVGASTGQFLVKSAALVSGNFPQNSGTAGLTVDSGLAVSNIVAKNAANTMAAGSSIILAKVNGTESSNAVTASGVAGVITTSSLSTAGAGSYAITWTNTFISATSVIGLTIQGGSNTTQNINFKVVPGSGSATLTIYNLTASTALNGTILIGYTVL